MRLESGFKVRKDIKRLLLSGTGKNSPLILIFEDYFTHVGYFSGGGPYCYQWDPKEPQIIRRVRASNDMIPVFRSTIVAAPKEDIPVNQERVIARFVGLF